MSLWSKKLVIVLPTFNESKNLRTLLDRIRKIVPSASVIIVDDSSDAENKKIGEIASIYKNSTVLTRQKKLGRGSAILAGFAHGLTNNKFEYFVEMDTDLAHNPSELPQLFDALIAQNAHLVIGSRYLEKSTIVDWPLKRLLLSKLINFFLNFWLGLHLHDYTNGYRLYKRQAVTYLVKTGLREKNFIALSESAFLIKKRGYKIVEVPITFTDRKHGESTVGTKELFMCLIGALRIRLR